MNAVSEHSKVFAWLIFPIFTVMGIEVVARYVFDSPTIWANELTVLIFGVYFVVGGAYTLLHDSHVKMDLLYQRLSLRKQAILDLVTRSLFFFPFILVVLIAGFDICWQATMQQRTTGQIWNPPIWPTKWGLVVGAVLLLLQEIVRVVQYVQVATGRRHSQ